MCYTVKFKLDVISEYQPGVRGSGFAVIVKNYSMSASAVKDWFDKMNQFLAVLADEQLRTRKMRRLKGGHSKAKYQDMEKELVKCVISRNEKGLRVKDKYFRMQEKSIYRRLYPAESSSDSTEESSKESDSEGKASKG